MHQITGEVMNPVEDVILSESDLARRLDVSVSGLRKWRRESTGPKFIRIGRLIRYSFCDMQAWLSTRKEGQSDNQ
jgi:predicted DNA-binding transcriptional regulator AlpA